ncbi:hypothetical protein N7466_007198 [Penicillium verhagenii]|uniref:uncharacterized protein n=1 Tax=Penicillium verhagenii TaxID=1562060 RepID=UPI00254540D7|nr:uncharacterized protein N7466_007198 [Penicillium verhagenii]KAJ5928242.1 hypothetical protein N7466_007198 [Penicillium verhagenii]
MAPQTQLSGRVALVTGGGQGIGRAMCLAFSTAGAKVVIADIDQAKGTRVATEIVERGGDAHFVLTDVTKSESIRSLVQETVRRFGKLDIAVNNAALGPDTSEIASLDEESWTRIIQTNLTSVAFCLKWELQHMQAQGGGGSIINLTSGSALRPQATMPAYVAAKSAVIGLTKVAAVENGRHGIRVNVISPAATNTPMLAQSLTDMGVTAEQLVSSSVGGHLGRLGEPEDIAAAALWLASDASSYVTGALFPVDGGYSV